MNSVDLNFSEAKLDDAPATITAVIPEALADAIRVAGCAVTTVERDGVTHLHSASHGVGFQVLWGNQVDEGGYADFTLSCPLRVTGGELPHAVLDAWHRSKRFARVAVHGELIVLEMDVTFYGGVTPAHLDAMLRLWVVMTGEFLLHLRTNPGGDGALPSSGSVVG